VAPSWLNKHHAFAHRAGIGNEVLTLGSAPHHWGHKVYERFQAPDHRQPGVPSASPEIPRSWPTSRSDDGSRRARNDCLALRPEGRIHFQIVPAEVCAEQTRSPAAIRVAICGLVVVTSGLL
jgi:hypothetical protein